MPIGTPFHSRTSVACVSQSWRTWSGYLAAASYEVVHDYEYHAIRSTAALIDVSPLFKYDVSGGDALRLVNRVLTRDAAKCAIGQALYACLCDHEGKVIQDGTVFRLAENHFRFNLAEPSLRWLRLNSTGLNVAIKDVSERTAAVAIQGPSSLRVLQSLLGGEIGELKFFRLRTTILDSAPVIVSRTGYTGDLGYELWFDAELAGSMWDRLLDAGRDFGIKPAGLLALDVARLEAGFILLDVDYTSAEKAIIPSQKYTPFEIGLGWTVDIKKDAFVGCEALRSEAERGPTRRIVGLEVDLAEFERLFAERGLPPELPLAAWRGGMPVYRDGRQTGHATTGSWSPLLKKYIALATVAVSSAEIGTRLDMEVTVDHVRKTVGARVVQLPFFDPPQKKSVFSVPVGST